MRWLFEARKTTKKWPEGSCAPFGPPFCWEKLKKSHAKDLLGNNGKIDGKRLVNMHFLILQSIRFRLMYNLSWRQSETHKLLSHGVSAV